MNDIQIEALKLRLEKLFNESSHFSICDVDMIGKSLSTNPKLSEHYNTLQLLHCVDYNDMSAAMKAELPNMVMECLSCNFEIEGLLDTFLKGAVKTNSLGNKNKTIRKRLFLR